MRRHLLTSAVLATTATLALAPAASADTAVASTQGPTAVSAYGGYMVWSTYDPSAKSYRLVLRSGDGKVSNAPVKTSTKPFDATLGPDSKNRVVVLYTRCSAIPSSSTDVSNGCDAYRLQISSRKESKLSFSSADYDEEWPAQWKDQFVFGRAVDTGSGSSRQRCDVPYRRAVSGGSSARMDRGRCGMIQGVALRGTVVGQTVQASGNSQVRLLSTKGGPVSIAASANFGEESNLFGGPALDATYVYATRYGVNPKPSLVRIKRSGLKKQEVEAHLDLDGAVAIDGGTISYVEAGVRGGGAGGCTQIDPCRVVRSPNNPFGSAKRVLPPAIKLTGPGGAETLSAPVPANQPLSLSGTLASTVVSGGDVTGTQPVAGTKVQLLLAAGAQGTVPYTATGVTATTAADGKFALTAAAPIPPVFGYGATTGGDVPTVSNQVFGNASAILTATPSATSVASGTQVTFTGTLDPAQPGRSDVKIQRLTARNCQTAQNGQQVCNDMWDTIAEASEAADGRSFTATTAITQSGTYTAVLPFLTGNFTAYSGRSADFQMTVTG